MAGVLQYSFKLLSFNPYDDMGKFDETNKFIVQMFGINAKGETASILVTDYKPYFYVKVPDEWKEPDRLSLIDQIKCDIDEKYVDDISDSVFVSNKKLYGFDGGKTHTFIKIVFTSEIAFKKAKNLWYIIGNDNGDYTKELAPDGYMDTLIYEAQIPPVLRLFHIKNISPSGWISLPKSKCSRASFKKTTCTYEFTIKYKDIISLPNKETMVPYKICSFDIEASSSHGDFPLAIKSYRKLSTNILDVWRHIGKRDPSEYIMEIILTAFSYSSNPIDDVDVVFPKKNIPQEKVVELVNKLIDMRLSGSKNEYHDLTDPLNVDVLGEEGQCSMEDTTGKYDFMKKRVVRGYGKKYKIIELLNDQTATRDTKLLEITTSLGKLFPKLEGDIVTFIGSTFIKNGEDKPYLNHCIARNTCDQMKDVPNAVLESYKTEKEVLLAWKNIIQKENPDIIIGYNIFGFDYTFLFDRSKELGIVDQFMKLGRNNNELSVKMDWRTKQYTLDGSTIFLASGQHDLNYPKMTGRLQIDLYNYLRREYQLSKYKLDYVSGYFIGDYITKISHNTDTTRFYTKNLTGLEVGNFINIDEEGHSTNAYKNGAKFAVSKIDPHDGFIEVDGLEYPDMKKKVRWGIAKDDVTPQDIFRMTNEGSAERSVIAKYCIQDCNLVQNLLKKIDVLTGFGEMAKLCSVPMEFLVLRGQGIKLTSYIAKKCREKDTLMPVVNKPNYDDGYEGAIVLDPKCSLYMDDPVACVDYSSLYPSSMISENISHDSKVLTREYDLKGKLIRETGETNDEGEYIYDNLEDYDYVDIQYDTYVWSRRNGNEKSALEKIKSGYKICRFAQHKDGSKSVMPSILEELLRARKATRKLIPQQTDDFMKNVLDKRQNSIKITANSLYGQTGAKTSAFYEKDCAASTTSIGRKLLTYAKRVIENAYKNREVTTKNHGNIITDAEYVYGDTDSVFFKFNPRRLDGTPIIGMDALDITIELAQEAGRLATMFLKKPHDLEYEKTFHPFCLLSKKRYVGMMYEHDVNKCKRKSMGIVLKRRDNAPIVKDIYGGIVDILMNSKDIEHASQFLKESLDEMANGTVPIGKLIITKSLRSGYANPDQIAHKVLADRIGSRDPGNKPGIGDRVAFVYISKKTKTTLQGERIETPEFVLENKLTIDYTHYITNQIMKPVIQVFSLVLEKLPGFIERKGTINKWNKELSDLRYSCKMNGLDVIKTDKKIEAHRDNEVKLLLFDKCLKKIHDKLHVKTGKSSIMFFMKKTNN